MSKKPSRKRTLADEIDERLGIKKPHVNYELGQPLTISIGKLPNELAKMFENGQLN